MPLRSLPSRGFKLPVLVTLAVAVFSAAAFAAGERAIMIREAQIFLTPELSSQKLDRVGRGREVVVLQRTPGWVQVFANIDKERDITGWLTDKGVVRTSTPDGDRILFGEAADSEDEASRSHGRKGAAQDAARLYGHMAEYFPKSPLAGEALYRSADIIWQIEKDDLMTRPSSHEMDPNDRPQLDEQNMREVRKKFPGTKWAALASYSLIDNKLCGEWRGLPKCPLRESEIYEKYAAEYPQSPRTAEALYRAAWRHAALVNMYKSAGEMNKSAPARARAIDLAQRAIAQFPESDWAQRSARLIYMLQQEIPTFGSQTD